MGKDEGRARVRQGRHRFFVRASIFIGLAAVAQASAALPPGPDNLALYWASLAVFVACALTILLPWSRFPRWAILIPTLGYLVSVTLLLISGGTNPSLQSTSGGLSALILLPVLAMALYYPGSYSAIVVVASMVSLTAFGVAVHSERGNGPAPPLRLDGSGGSGRGDGASPSPEPRGEGPGLG